MTEKTISSIVPAGHVGIKANEWISVTAKLELSAVHKSGNYFIGEVASMDVTEYVNNPSHNHKVDGDDRMVKEAAQKFLDLPFVSDVYSYKSHGRVHLMIVVSEDTDDMSFQLAKVKIDFLSEHQDFDFEIRYSTTQKFDPSTVTKNAVSHAGR